MVAGSSATSSALQLGDLALVWSNVELAADLVKIDDDLASDIGIVTAIILSLFVDRRANSDDAPPSGDPLDRRGWWADQYAETEGDLIGSRLWLLARAKRTPETPRLAVEYCREALAWMIEDSVVASFEFQTEMTAKELLIGLTANRPGRDPISLRFAHAWDATLANTR